MTTVKVIVEYELDYSEEINKHNLNDLVDLSDIVSAPTNITAIRKVSIKKKRN